MRGASLGYCIGCCSVRPCGLCHSPTATSEAPAVEGAGRDDGSGWRFPKASFPISHVGQQVRGPGHEGSRYLRDRLGIRLAFLEDPMLDSMLAARQTKGARAAIQGQPVDKVKREAEEKRASGEALQAARSLFGPKGGLPTLKADLATLLHVRRGTKTLRGVPATTATTSAPATSTSSPAASAALPVPARVWTAGPMPLEQSSGPLRQSCWHKSTI